IDDNSFTGGYLATKHLLDCGHKKIGIIAGELSKTTARTRYEGFEKAMAEANLEINKDWVMEGHFEPEDGYECMNKILAQADLPTAVFCCNDVMALGAISAITEKGLRVPDDISIIGYDNIHSSRFYAPPLTTVHQSKSRLGAQAVNLLFERISQKDKDDLAQPQSRIDIHPELVVRKSVKTIL
ncbi:substrate-binding domain-containing protein, partial [Rodentibacter pneumotropicus]